MKSLYLHFLLIASAATLLVIPVRAQTANVSAKVGDYTLNISGYITPYASVVGRSDSTFLGSTVADIEGRFAIPDILIKRGFSDFCLNSLDFKRAGESQACFSFPPAMSNIVLSDVFLPPTIGVQRSQIGAGGEAEIFGYTMPSAMVTVYQANGEEYKVIADGSGYYQLTFPKLTAGAHTIFARAQLNGKLSELPSRGVLVKALTTTEQAKTILGNFWVWIVIAVIILIVIVLRKKLRILYRLRNRTAGAKKKK